jgi:hypothetical protein
MAYSGTTNHLDAHRRSPEFRASCSARMKKYNAKRMAGPRCGARRKRDGEPCQQWALYPNGRCKFHGGATPSGDRWHVPTMAAPGAKNAEDKLARKLRSLAARKKKQVARVAAMTPEERARYETWHKRNPPGPVSRRQRIRNERKQNEDLRKLIAGLDAPASSNPAKQAIKVLTPVFMASVHAPISADKLRELFP